MTSAGMIHFIRHLQICAASVEPQYPVLEATAPVQNPDEPEPSVPEATSSIQNPVEQESPASQEKIPAQNPAENKKLRIKLKAYYADPLKVASKMILDVARNTGAQVSGPVPLPTKRRLYCVLRSPHVNKDSREHFEIRVHSRLIDIRKMSSDTIDQLMGLDIPAGVDAKIKIL